MNVPVNTSNLLLAYVDDAHNLGCNVRLLGEDAAHQARYSSAIQENGVVIRACHVVVVDTSREPFEVIWRIGTRATVEGLDGPHITLNLGYRTLTIPLRDRRPEEERARPLAVGDTVLLQGSPLEEAAVVDLMVGGELAHPDRLRAQLGRIIVRLSVRQPE
jgi:hypothetical protein